MFGHFDGPTKALFRQSVPAPQQHFGRNRLYCGHGATMNRRPSAIRPEKPVREAGEFEMKKLLIALTAAAAMSGSAFAADMARPYTKAPAPVAPVYNWTGFYIFGGGGGGIWDAKSNTQSTGVPAGFGAAGTALTRDQKLGGDGWFGTVGIGYDWQFSPTWVAGVFADGQFGEIKGSLSDAFLFEGQEKLRTSYAAGVRLGYLVAPNVLSYVNGGYSGSEWSGTTMTSLAIPAVAAALTTPSFHRNGWFVGGGVENNLDIFGINFPGLFMKTEYRTAFYDRATLPETLVGTGLLGTAVTFKPTVTTISTSLVYRFNWGGPAIRY
jgi:outer membrane immunogenic protein